MQDRANGIGRIGKRDRNPGMQETTAARGKAVVDSDLQARCSGT